MSFLVPFAIYGLNLFNGQLKACNDGNFGYSDLSHCIGEYRSRPYAWDILAPRVVANPYYNFDNFGDSLFILFQIVSQEGWTDVLWSAMSINGVGQQPQPFASQANGLFFVAFNLLGAVFVLTLFVSVFMRNYTEQTGVAFLTAEQRSWLELRKLLRQISPSKRSINKKNRIFKTWCYRIAVKKHGRWAKFITGILLLHLLLLVLEFYPEVEWWERARGMSFPGIHTWTLADACRLYLLPFHIILHCQHCYTSHRLELASIPSEFVGPLFDPIGIGNICDNHYFPCSLRESSIISATQTLSRVYCTAHNPTE